QVDATAGVTVEGTVLGTPEYMSPEQCEAISDVDAAADIYAAGVILYEMACGRVPFFGTRTEVQQGHLARRPPRPSSFAPVSRPLEEVILRCLAKAPAERFHDVRSLRAALLGASSAAELNIDSTQTQAAPAVGGRRSARTERRCGLLFAESMTAVAELERTASSFGGQLAHAANGVVILVFENQATANPVDRAQRTAQHLIRGGVARALVIDFSIVTVRGGADGSLQYFSPLFSRPPPLASADEPIRLTAAADALATTAKATGTDAGAPELVGRGEVVET